MRVDFLTPLRVERISEDDWRVIGPFRVMVRRATEDFNITVPNGFITDFASAPRLPMAYLVAGGVAERSAVLHDYLYTSGLVARDEADAIFRSAMQADKVSGWRRWLIWSAVRMFGAGRYRP